MQEFSRFLPLKVFAEVIGCVPSYITKLVKAGIPIPERIARYLDRCNPAISGQGGHRTTFKVALALVRGFDLSPEQALPYMLRYNERCDPPWTEHELKHKLDDADRIQPKNFKPRGYLL